MKMEACNMNALEHHDRLYRMAYQKYLNREVEFARQLALEALSQMEAFRREQKFVPASDRVTCRAQALLDLIERQVTPEKR